MFADPTLAAANVYYFNLAAQLATLTTNKTYEVAADDRFKLLETIGFISDKYEVFDGAQADDCSSINKLQWSSNAAMLLQGSVTLYNHVSLI